MSSPPSPMSDHDDHDDHESGSEAEAEAESSLLNTLERLFSTRCLYTVLGVSSPEQGQSATAAQLKKCYHKQSLKYHPDRVRGDDEEEKRQATEKFQALGAVYSLLSDAGRRALYDETGEVDDASEATFHDENKDWDQYWRMMFKKITPQDIANFESEYKDSAEELSDLKQAYLDGHGDMNYILDNVLCCTADDEVRFAETIRQWIKDDEVPAMDKFTKETDKQKKKRKRRLDKEAEEAEEMAADMGLCGGGASGGGEDTLRNMIMKRQEQRAKDSDSFLDALAAKYGGQKSKAKAKSSKKK